MTRNKLIYYTPTAWLAYVLKSKSEIARVCDVSPSAVSKWQSRLNGAVPSSVMVKLLTHASRHRLDITAEDLILGRTISHDRR